MLFNLIIQMFALISFSLTRLHARYNAPNTITTAHRPARAIMHKTVNNWVITGFFALSLLSLTSYGDDDDKAQIQSKPGKTLSTAGNVRLSREQQHAAGIKVQILAETSQRPEFQAYAKVADIQPLLNLSTRQRALQAELTVTRTTLTASQKALARTARLHKEDAASARSLQQTQAQWSGDAARAAAAEQQLAILRTEALQQWGPTIAGWIFNQTDPALERLLLRQDVLVELALPPERSLPSGTEKIRLVRQGDQRLAIAGRLVSAAPRTGEITQGETWFAIAPSNALRTGMRLDAWVPTDAAAATGVEFPVDAVLWRGNKPWVYLQTGEDSFTRRLIPVYTDHSTTWFVSTGVKPGERLVINGAQLLLSEEFRGQIPDENDD